MNTKRTLSRGIRGRRFLVPIVTVLVGLMLSFAGFSIALSWDRQMANTEFEKEAENRFETIKSGIESNLNAVVSLKAFFESSQHVDRDEFRDFARSYLSIDPSIQALEWIPHVPGPERATYEAAARQDGLPGFQITERKAQGEMVRAAWRSEYFPVYFLMPHKGNRLALGFDLGSDPMRREALEKSRDTGEMVATGRVTLVQETSNQFGFLVFAPVYRKGAAVNSVQARRENLKGFALGVFRVGDIVEKSLKPLKPEGINIYLFDESASNGESFLYFHPARTGKTQSSPAVGAAAGPRDSSGPENTGTFKFAGREWLIMQEPTPGFISARKTWQPWIILTAGLLLTAALASYLLRSRQAAERLGESEGNFRTLVDNAPEAIYVRIRERFAYANEAALRLFGATSREQILHQLVLDRFHPDFHEAVRERMRLTDGGKIPVPALEEKCLRLDGTSVDVEVSSMPIAYESRNATLVFLRDITERTKAEKELRRLSRLYDVLRQVNQAIVRIKSKDELLSAVCRLLVERGAVNLAWIGRLDPETSRINQVAHFGDQARMLGESDFYADGSPARQGNPGRSIREGRPFVCNECDSSLCLYPSERAPARFGFRSCGSFPFRFQGRVSGVLTLYIYEQDFFQEREIELLDEVALNISFALDKIEGDSQRDRLKEQYQQQSVFLRTLMDAMPYPVFYKDTQLRYLGSNRAFEEFAGRKADRLIGHTAYDIWPKEQADDFGRTDREVLGNPDRQTLVIEAPVPDHEGNFYEFLVRKATFKDQDGKVAGLIGMMVDITERKAAEAAIKESESKFRSYMENAPLAVLVADREGRFLDFNRSAVDLLGYDGSELSGMSIYKIHPEEDRDVFFQDFADLLNKGRVQTERRIRRADGQVRWVAIHAALISERLSLGYFQDITEGKLAEIAIRESEEKFRAISDSAQDAVILLDNQGAINFWNPAAERILGYSAVEVLGRNAHSLLAPQQHHEDYSRAFPEFARTGRGKVIGETLELTALRKDGKEIPVEVSLSAFQVKGLWHCAGIMRDITERKVAEHALLESESKYRKLSHEFTTLLDTIPDGLTLVSPDYRIIWTNRALASDFHISSADIIGRTCFEFFHNSSVPCEKCCVRESLATGRTCSREYTDPMGKTIEVRCSPVLDDSGKAVNCIEVTRDVTEVRRTELHLRQAQKMEALGTLAGGIAHDFNNILGIIMGFTQLATYELGKESPVQEKLDQVLKAINRARDLVKQILAFSRRSEQQQMPLELGIVVKEAMQILRPSLPSTIEINTNVASKAAVLADPTQMHQVLMNLCTNAAHAMREKGGILEVSLADVALEEGTAFHDNLQPGRYVGLTVKDSGHGIDPSIMDSIFDPFFTTKQLGEGTGLGLSVVHGIVKNHGGSISVESTPGEGAAFTVLIPAFETGNLPEKAEPGMHLAQGRERVLVVDDEPLLADMVKRMLEKQGYDVVSRTSGIEALEAIRHQPAGRPFDLVVTDMTMPHFTGVDLARELSAGQPGLPVILMTGFSQQVDADRAREMGIQGFLMKPVPAEELAAVVRSVLDRRRK